VTDYPTKLLILQRIKHLEDTLYSTDVLELTTRISSGLLSAAGHNKTAEDQTESAVGDDARTGHEKEWGRKYKSF